MQNICKKQQAPPSAAPQRGGASRRPLGLLFLHICCMILQLFFVAFPCFSMTSAEKIGFPGPFCPGPFWGLPKSVTREVVSNIPPLPAENFHPTFGWKCCLRQKISLKNVSRGQTSGKTSIRIRKSPTVTCFILYFLCFFAIFCRLFIVFLPKVALSLLFSFFVFCLVFFFK